MPVSSTYMPMYEVISSPMLLYRLRCLFPSCVVKEVDAYKAVWDVSLQHKRTHCRRSTRVPSGSVGTHPWTKPPHRTCWTWLRCSAATAGPILMTAPWLDALSDEASHSCWCGRPPGV